MNCRIGWNGTCIGCSTVWLLKQQRQRDAVTLVGDVEASTLLAQRRLFLQLLASFALLALALLALLALLPGLALGLGLGFSLGRCATFLLLLELLLLLVLDASALEFEAPPLLGLLALRRLLGSAAHLLLCQALLPQRLIAHTRLLELHRLQQTEQLAADRVAVGQMAHESSQYRRVLQLLERILDGR